MGKEKFLLYMLAGIFTFQATVFGAGLYFCTQSQNVTEVCPKIGERYEQTFNVMIATVLALMTGSALSNKE
tara:strand:- start:271 stop:483 length:213 start_codon:yes stop_codon:yes gene_type:complete